MLVDALLHSCRTAGSMEAVRDPTAAVSFKQLTLLAMALRQVALSETHRDRVGLLLPGGIGFVASFFGTLWAGKIAVPLNFLLSPGELSAILRDAEIDLLFSVHHFDKTVAELGLKTLFLEDLPLKRRALAAWFRPKPPPPKGDPSQLAVLLYTSGTSGACKGVELSTANLLSNCHAVIEAAELRDDDRFLAVLPPFHVFGLTGNVLVQVVRGLPVQVLPRFSPAAVLRAIDETRPTILMAIPSMYGALLRTKTAGPDTFRSFRLLVSGGEPLPERIAVGFRERFGQELCEGYGLTETSPVISLSAPRDNVRGAVGRPVRGVEVRITAADGRPAPTGEEGEIVVRGPGVMRGYHHRPAETAAVLDADGWFSTGDIGTLDADGFLRITGRKKEMLIVGGENVFPREIEGVLERHPAVEEAAVIGVPDDSRGEAPVAFLMLKSGASASDQELRTFARQHLAGYKVPREIRMLDELPRGPTGKVAKRTLKERYAAT